MLKMMKICCHPRSSFLASLGLCIILIHQIVDYTNHSPKHIILTKKERRVCVCVYVGVCVWCSVCVHIHVHVYDKGINVRKEKIWKSQIKDNKV